MENYIFVPFEKDKLPDLLRVFQSFFYRNRERVYVFSIKNDVYIDIGRRVSNWINCSFHISPNLTGDKIKNFFEKNLVENNHINIFIVDIDTAKSIINLLDSECIFDIPQEDTIVRLKDKRAKKIILKN